jgi:hypothetical protein
VGSEEFVAQSIISWVDRRFIDSPNGKKLVYVGWKNLEGKKVDKLSI